ncbi:MAG: ATP-NAD kinase family protein [Acidimicrobiales bacterium]
MNPIAGMGGRVGLHGTDGPELLAEARKRGAAAVTPARVVRALRRLDPGIVRLLTAPGPMGAEVACESGLEHIVVDVSLGEETTGTDTETAARLLAAERVDLLLFAGGDGTARDVVRGAGANFPILGIPSGVKMRSGVFAASPEAAGEIAADFLRGTTRPTARAELLDASPEAGTDVLFAVATVPNLRGGRLAGPKASGPHGDIGALDALCAAVANELTADTLYLFGPGSTTGRILEALDLAGTPLGVDAVVNSQLIGKDLGEDEIVGLMAEAGRTKLVLGVIGGQGFLLGRGNQQLGTRVLCQLGHDDILIVATAEKLTALSPACLRVDCGEREPFFFPDRYCRVRTGPSRYMMMAVGGST